MAWLEIHQALPTHKKLLAASDSLGVRPAPLLGHLVCFWLWALDNAPDGDLSGLNETMISRAAQWTKSSKRFVDVLVAVRFLDSVDGSYLIHDWEDYAGKLIDQRNRNKRRQQTYRERLRNATPNGDIPVTSPLPSGLHNEDVTVTSQPRNGATVPDHTVPDSTSSPLPPSPEIHTSEDADLEEIPDTWYGTLCTIPGWMTERIHAEEWVKKTGVSEEMALQVATDLKAKWGGKGWKWKDTWATFQSWCRRNQRNEGSSGNPSGHQSGHQGSGRGRREKIEYSPSFPGGKRITYIE